MRNIQSFLTIVFILTITMTSELRAATDKIIEQGDITATVKEIDDALKKIKEYNKRIERTIRELIAVNKEIARIKGKYKEKKCPTVYLTSKSPEVFEAVENRIFPITYMTERNYKITRYTENGVIIAVQLDRIGEGERIDEFTVRVRGKDGRERYLLNEDSLFSEAIKGIDPANQFASFIVHPDSFGAFRKAREILHDKGIDVGWEPEEQDYKSRIIPIGLSTVDTGQSIIIK